MEKPMLSRYRKSEIEAMPVSGLRSVMLVAKSDMSNKELTTVQRDMARRVFAWAADEETNRTHPAIDRRRVR